MSIGLLNPKLPHASHEFRWRNVRDGLLTNTRKIRLTNRHPLKHASPLKLDPHIVGLELKLLEPFGDACEDFYQQRLLLGLAWWSPTASQKIVIAG